jgi:putative flippase GtrA
MDSVDGVECGATLRPRSSGLRGAVRGGERSAMCLALRKLPRPIRFLGVGGIGLLTDLTVFTLAFGVGHHPLAARLVSIVVATLVTWRLNRAVTFDPTGRHQSHEALRYALVTAIAQGTNYTVFASLVMAALTVIPQIAVLAGAVAGAGLSYDGHRLFSFASQSAFPGDLLVSWRRIVPR